MKITKFLNIDIEPAPPEMELEVDKIDNLLIKDFTDEELNEYEKTLQ